MASGRLQECGGRLAPAKNHTGLSGMSGRIVKPAAGSCGCLYSFAARAMFCSPRLRRRGLFFHF
jgi:hypothetical protein